MPEPTPPDAGPPDPAAADAVEVEELLVRYCDLVDRAEVDAVAELFTPDATFDYGLGRVFTGRDALRALLGDRLRDAYSATSHHLSNIAVTVDGDRAEARSYVYAWHRRRDGGDHAHIWGRYHDELVRTPDGWRIARRAALAAGERGFPTPDGLPAPFARPPRAGDVPERGDPAAGAPAPVPGAPARPPGADAVLEAMATARAVRRFRPDPVPEALLRELVEAATRAPSPRNSQPWELVVVRDEAVRAELGRLVAPRAEEVLAAVPRLSDPAKATMYRHAAELITSLGRAPAIVFVAGWVRDYGPEFPAEEIMLSAAHTAAQNLLVAARALGLGGAFTTLHLHAEEQIRALLALPDGLRLAVTIPVGWPDQPTGPVRRRPVDEVLHWDRYAPG